MTGMGCRQGAGIWIAGKLLQMAQGNWNGTLCAACRVEVPRMALEDPLDGIVVCPPAFGNTDKVNRPLGGVKIGVHPLHVAGGYENESIDPLSDL